MKFTDKCVQAVKAYTEGMNGYDKDMGELKKRFSKGDISSNEYARRSSELTGISSGLNEQLYQTVYAARDEYISGLPYRYRRDSETMDANDLALLNSEAAGLTDDDVLRMFNKHSGSLGMQGAIVEANAKRENPASLTYFSRGVREEAARTFAETAVAAAHERGLRAAMMIDGKYIPSELIGE